MMLDQNETQIIGQKPKVIADGLHQGQITKLMIRTVTGQDYSYLDLHIKPDDSEFHLKASYSTYWSESSKLGELTNRFSIPFIEGGVLPYNQLEGRRVQFQTLMKKRGEKSYANILIETVKPVEEEIVK